MSLLPIVGSQHYIHFNKKAKFLIFVMLALGRIMTFKDCSLEQALLVLRRYFQVGDKLTLTECKNLTDISTTVESGSTDMIC